jgi:hypothetical protein
MERKNPDNKPLRIVYTTNDNEARRHQEYCVVLSNLAIAQSNLVKAGKDSAMPHFIAIVKELERVYGFEFKIMEEASALPQTD